MINGSMILNGIASSVLSDKLKPHIDKAMNGDEKQAVDWLRDLFILQVELATWLKDQPAIEKDIFSFATISKSTPYTIPFGHREHTLFFSTTAVNIDITSTALGTFTLPLPACDWKLVDFPERSIVYLDGAATPNSIIIWQRETNANVAVTV